MLTVDDLLGMSRSLALVLICVGPLPARVVHWLRSPSGPSPLVRVLGRETGRSPPFRWRNAREEWGFLSSLLPRRGFSGCC